MAWPTAGFNTSLKLERPRPIEGAYDRMLLPVRLRPFVAVGSAVSP